MVIRFYYILLHRATAIPTQQPDKHQFGAELNMSTTHPERALDQICSQTKSSIWKCSNSQVRLFSMGSLAWNVSSTLWHGIIDSRHIYPATLICNKAGLRRLLSVYWIETDSAGISTWIDSDALDFVLTNTHFRAKLSDRYVSFT